jgi:cell division protease FtsH
MNDKENRKPEPRKSEQTPQRNHSSMWFVLIILASLLLCIFLVIQQSSGDAIAYPDLLKILETNQFDEKDATKLISDPKASIVSVRKAGKKDVWIDYTKPTDLIVDDRQVIGTIMKRTRKSNNDQESFEETKFTCAKSGQDGSSDRLYALLDESHVEYKHSPGPSKLATYGFFMLPLLLLCGFFYLMMRRLGSSGGPMQFGRSRGKLMADDDLGVMFTDVAGIDEAVEEVKEVVDFLQSPEKYQSLGGKIPRGVLLVGPPGTGKTLLAKAIAGEAGVPFFSLSGSDFVEMFVGVGAARVRDMFQQAVAKAPCIIFIDELDALGKTRSANAAGGHDEREQTLNALLVEMDGFASNSGVIVMAATNRPETLDQALMRPGRFDRHVLVDRPDVMGREAILKVHVKAVKLDDDVELKQVASISPGFAGAELANLVNEAALLAARGGCSTVQMKHFNEGVERVTAGLEKKQRVMNEDEKERVAYHEAGHALIAFSLPNTDPVHKVSIIPRGLAALGYTMQRPTDDRYLMTKSELESRLQVLLAGTLAEELIYTDISTGASNDLERVTDIARSMVMQYGMSSLGRINFKNERGSAFLAGASGGSMGQQYSEDTARKIDAEVQRIVNDSLESVRKILVERKQALVALTERLIEIESIDAEELKVIMDENLPGPRLVPGTDVPNRESESSDSSPADSSDDASVG